MASRPAAVAVLATAAYVDMRRDYVTSEPALDYAAASILLLAALEAHC